MKRWIWLTLATLSVSGCNLLKSTPDEPLISSLEYKPVAIEKGPTEALDDREIMQNYRELIRLKPDQRLSSEATRRLADLELDSSERMILEQPEMLASDSGPDAGDKAITISSIPLYESLLEKDPNYPNRDNVLYQLSRAYELVGEQEKMMDALERLITDYPDSSHWAEAQFRRAERLFVLQRFKQAENAYGAILKQRKQSPFYDRALFKHGWSRFKQRRIEAGLDSFTQLLDRKLNDLPTMDASRLSPADQELLKETLRVISLTFSELGGTQQITSYFKKHGHRDYEFMVYRGLGDLYQKQERIKDSADAYLAFVELDPTHLQAPKLSVQVIDLYAKHDFPALARESKKSFTERYRVQGEHWKKFDPEDKRWLNDKLRSYLKELAEYHHALVQQIPVKDKKAQAERAKRGTEAVFWYQRYINSFPSEQATGGMSFLLAELLIDLQRYPEAIKYYELSAYLYPIHDKSSEAGYAAILAYELEEKQLTGEQRKTWHLAGIESALRFAKTFPDDPHAVAVLTQAAERLYGVNDLKKAREAALQVIAWQPPAKASLRRTAWTVAAHTAFDTHAYQEAEIGYKNALALLPKQDKTYQDLQERLAASIYQQAVSLRDAGNQQAAAQQFLRVGILVPTASIRATAEFDAAASLIAMKDWARSVKVLEAFRKRYPESQLLPDISNKLAVAYLENNQPLKAAAELSSIARRGGSPELRREAGWQSAELYAKAGLIDKATQAYTHYIEAFPQPLEQAVEARQKLVELYDKQRQPGKRDYWLQEIVKADAKAGKARSDRTRFLAAQSTLRLAQPAYDSFQQIKLKAPLQKNLKRKKTQMQSAIAAYKKAANYGIAEITTAATFRIGELYQQFSQALLESERPKGLNEEELEQYEILLEEQAYPFEDKAIALHETNTKRTVKGIYDQWVKRSFEALAQLLPARYAKREKAEEVFNAIN